MSGPGLSSQAIIDELVRSTGASDAFEAIRFRARELTSLFVSTFGEPGAPIDVEALASLRGIQRSDEPPIHSDDAELVPDGHGGVTMRVNPDRPETRQRFSMAHEISHTFFPDYTSKAWCRTDARYRDRQNPDEFLESLCDIGAAELLFPQPWFGTDAASVCSAHDLMQLASTYHASRDATIRRYAETSPEPIAAVFLTWKLKPTQKSTVGNKSQPNLFGQSAEEQVRDALRLRIDYAIASDAFRAAGHFLPKDKSVPNDGPVYQAASSGVPSDEAHDRFEPVSSQIRSLRKLADATIKAASTSYDIATRKLAATKSDEWNALESRDLHKDLIRTPRDGNDDNIRVVLNDALKHPPYFQRQVHWLQSRFPSAIYADVDGLCKSVTRTGIESEDWSLTPGKYVGVAALDEDENFDFGERMEAIRDELDLLNTQAAGLAEQINQDLDSVIA